jgi:hypothetical protein
MSKTESYNDKRNRQARERRARKKLGLYQPKAGENFYKHGLNRSPEHRIWLGIIMRCHGNSPKRRDWIRYQGAGVTVCQRWRESFLNFHHDVGPKPTPKHTIDRFPDRRWRA